MVLIPKCVAISLVKTFLKKRKFICDLLYYFLNGLKTDGTFQVFVALRVWAFIQVFDVIRITGPMLNSFVSS
jgi:hypothetical protein